MSGDGRHVLFRAAGERFALPLEAVQQVVTPQPPFARVPRTGEAVRGAMNLRGRVVAVVDLGPLLGLAAQPLRPGQGQVVVLGRDRGGLGLLIEAVLGIERLEAPSPAGDGELVRGVASAGGSAVTVLDPDALAERSQALFGVR